MRFAAMIAVASVLALSPVGAAAQAPQLQWGPVPPSLPAGGKMAVLQGDPSGDGIFTLRLDMPAGYVIPPHFHPTDEHVTVISGSLVLGMGDKADESKGMTLGQGGFMTAPANAHHFAMAKTHTVVQVHAKGPFAITYVNPNDDPSKAKPAP
jgi:quercetin dioxygenase-like cupin family protein